MEEDKAVYGSYYLIWRAHNLFWNLTKHGSVKATSSCPFKPSLSVPVPIILNDGLVFIYGYDYD